MQNRKDKYVPSSFSKFFTFRTISGYPIVIRIRMYTCLFMNTYFFPLQILFLLIYVFSWFILRLFLINKQYSNKENSYYFSLTCIRIYAYSYHKTFSFYRHRIDERIFIQLCHRREYFLLKCLNYFFCLIISNIFSFAFLSFFETRWPVEKLYYTCRTEIMKYRRRIKICLLPSSGFPNEF